MNTANENEAAFEPTPGQRKLLRAVYIMGIALVLLFLALMAGIIWKASRDKPAPKPEDLALSLGLKAEDIRTTQLAGGQLAITTASEIIVVDVGKRKVLLREPLGQ